MSINIHISELELNAKKILVLIATNHHTKYSNFKISEVFSLRQELVKQLKEKGGIVTAMNADQYPKFSTDIIKQYASNELVLVIKGRTVTYTPMVSVEKLRGCYDFISGSELLLV